MQRADPSLGRAFDSVPVLRSVGGRSFLLLTGLLIVVMAGAVAVIGARNYDHETDLLRERSEAQARFLASVSPEPIFFRDFLRLETLARNAIDDPSTVHVVFLDNDGRSMTRSIDTDDPTVLAAADSLDDFDSATIADLLVADGDIRAVIQPVDSEGVRLGEVRLVYSVEPAQQNARRFMIDASIAAAIVLALILVTTLVVFRRKVRHPLRDLTIKTQALANGRFDDDDVDVQRRDEIGLLQQAFNEMASELRGTLDGLERARDEAERADRVKTEFLANMSHEIRTPLNAVLGLSDLLLDSNLTDDQRELVVTMHRSGDALLEMLNEILDYSKLEHGRLELDVEPFDLRELVESTAELFGAAVGEKGITLETHVDEELPRFVAGDEGRVRQVLVNLVGNAVKFTDQGGVRVSVTAGGGDRVVFTVEDSGIGLDPAEADALFEPFRQADSTTTRVFGGTGLGLAISQGLVDMMGGSIQATGEVGVGATFSFEVSLPPSSPVAPAPAPVAALDRELGRRHPLRILLAEDNTVNQLVATRLFARLGYTIDIAQDGVEAVSMALDGAYDLVLMDIQMPRLDGVQAMQRLTSLLPPDRCPRIVACTAHALAGDRERYLAAGMAGYLSKPLERSQIAAIVESTTRRSDTPVDVAPPAAEASVVPTSTSPPIDDLPVVDRAELAALVGDDAEMLLGELLPVFRRDAADRLVAIGAAVSAGDTESLRLEAHALKGGARAIAISSIGDAAARLEAIGAEGSTTGAHELIEAIEHQLARVDDELANRSSG